MNISYNWLKDLIDSDLSPEDTANQLTRVGITVEGVEPHGDDFVFDIDLTSNRSDCLSHNGIARELRVICGAENGVTDDGLGSVPFPSILAPDIVKIDNTDLCNRFTARVIHGVKIAPSPDWLIQRLEAIGERSINNVADITNYVMHELGQPMHAFDLDKLAEKRIVVRAARDGETIRTLDEVERKLDASMLLICDAEKPIAVGGIMGGLDSSITDATVNVLLEVAYFNRDNIRQTSRKLGLATEASYRFERGVDIENLLRASDRAASLICELAGGEIADIVDVYPIKYSANSIKSDNISLAVKRLTGLDVQMPECVRILTSLGIQISGQNEAANTFLVPSWRHDIAIEADLVEEIARHIGYDKIAVSLPPAYGAGEYQKSESRKKILRQSMVDAGFNEALSYSFVPTSFDESFLAVPSLAKSDYVTLQDSVIEGSVRMRPTLLVGLLEAVKLNLNQQLRNIKLFEIGNAFAVADDADDAPKERELFSFIVTGSDAEQNRDGTVRELDFYDAKGFLEAGLDAIGISGATFGSASVKHLMPGQAAGISFGEKVFGTIGRMNSELASQFKIKQPVYLCEIDLQWALEQQIEQITYRPLPRYPSVVRDVSFITKRSLSFGEIREKVLDQKFDIVRDVVFVDIFEGKGMESGERSLTVRFEYRSSDRTLTDAEVAAVHESIVKHLENALAIKPRY